MKLTRFAETCRHKTHQIGFGEKAVLDELAARGQTAEPQHPFQTRNIDIAIGQNVAVEIWLSSGLPLSDPYCRKRLKQLVKGGWWCCYVLISRVTKRLDVGSVADKLMRFVEMTKRNHPDGRQHWVIRGSGELQTVFGDDLNEWSHISAAKHRAYVCRHKT